MSEVHHHFRWTSYFVTGSLGGLAIAMACSLPAQDRARTRPGPQRGGPQRGVPADRVPASTFQLTIANEFRRSIDVYQVDAAGEEKFYGKVPGNERVVVETTPGQTWRCKLFDRVVAEYKAEPGVDQTMEVAPPYKKLALPAAGGAATPKADPLDKSLADPGTVQVTLSLDNQRPAGVEMFWVDQDGKEHAYGKLPAGLTNGLQTWSGHLWRFKLDGQVVGAYRATKDKDQSVTISKMDKGVTANADDRSRNDGTENVKLTVENQRNKEIEQYWVNFDGTEISYGRVPPGATAEIRTGAGHLWRYRQDGQLLSQYRATRSAEQSHVLSGQQAPKPEQRLPEVSVNDGNTQVQLKFENTRREPVKVLWIDGEGKEQDYGQIEGAATDAEPRITYPGHLWRFKAGEKIVGTYRVTRVATQTYSIPADPKPVRPDTADRSEPWINTPVALELFNRRDVGVEVFWYSAEGKEHKVGYIEPGTSVGGGYCPGQLFRFRENGKPVFEYRTTALPKQHVVVPADERAPDPKPKFAAITFDPTGDWDLPANGGRPVRLGWQNGQVQFDGNLLSLVADRAYGVGSGDQQLRLTFVDENTVDFQAYADLRRIARWVRLGTSNKSNVRPDNQPDNRNNYSDSWYTLDQPDIDNRREQSDTYGDSDASQIPKIDFILSGYHLFKMHPYDFQKRGVKGSGRRIFAQPSKDLKFWSLGGDYKMPDWLQYDSAVRGSSATDGFTFFSQRDRQESWGTNVGLDLGFKGAKLGLEASYEETKENTNTRETIGLFVSAQQSAYWLTLLKKRIQFDPGFVDALQQEGNFSSHEKCLAFFDSYGTHYPLAVLYGGRAIRSESIVKESFGESLAKEWSVSGAAEGTVKGVDIGLKAGYKQGSSTKSFESTELSQIRTKSIGGEGVTPDNWTLGDKVVPIQLELRPLFELMRPELLPNLPAAMVNSRRQQLENAWKRYNDSVQLADYSARPRMFEITLVDWVMEYDDDGGPANVFGNVTCRVMKDGKKIPTSAGSDYGFSRTDANGSAVIAGNNYVERMNFVQRVVLFPELRTEGNRIVADYHLERYAVRMDCNLVDYDRSSGNDPVDFAFEFSLSNLEEGGRSPTLTYRKSEAGFGSGCGRIRVNVDVREVGELRIDDVKHVSEPPPWQH